jgi:ABC-type branched-subunit amino acid transport system substrate-binding protein
MRKAFTAAAAAAALTVAGCGSGAGGGSGDAVKVGLLANLTGDAAPSFGEPFQHGLELALGDAQDDLDDAGIEIEVVTEDAKSAVPSAVTGYNKLRSEEVSVVLQDSQSPLGQAIAPLANDDKIPMLSGAGSELENEDGYAFRFTDLGTPTMAMGPYLAEQGAEKVGVVVASDNPSFATLADATEAGLEGGYASRQEISSADSDFAAVLANLRQDGVDAVVLSVLPAQAGNLMLQMEQSGGFEDVEVIGTVATSLETFTVAEDAAAGFVFPQVWAPGAKGADSFESAYEAKYGETPTAYGALGYQVGWITVAAILEAAENGDVTGTAIRDALPAASESELVAEHGILELTLDAEGKATSTGVIASFDESGEMATAVEGS